MNIEKGSVGHVAIIITMLALVSWLVISLADSAPTPEPTATVDQRTLFVIDCVKASGMGLEMRPVCSCMYDEIIAGATPGDADMAERCLRDHSDILE